MLSKFIQFDARKFDSGLNPIRHNPVILTAPKYIDEKTEICNLICR